MGVHSPQIVIIGAVFVESGLTDAKIKYFVKNTERIFTFFNVPKAASHRLFQVTV